MACRQKLFFKLPVLDWMLQSYKQSLCWVIMLCGDFLSLPETLCMENVLTAIAVLRLSKEENPQTSSWFLSGTFHSNLIALQAVHVESSSAAVMKSLTRSRASGWIGQVPGEEGVRITGMCSSESEMISYTFTLFRQVNYHSRHARCPQVSAPHRHALIFSDIKMSMYSCHTPSVPTATLTSISA